MSPGATLGNPGTATLTIVDDDAPGACSSARRPTTSPRAPPRLTITVSRVGGTASGTTVQYRVVPGDPGTATGGGIDYTLTPGTLSFGANETAKTFTVSIVNDTLIEPDETVNIELFNPSAGLTIGVPGTTRLTIHDNDAPTFRFGAASYAVVEGATAKVTVIRAGGLGSAVTVGYQVTGGSASGGGVDYTLSDGTVTFPPGSTTQTFAIPTTGDTLYEGAETIVLQLVDPSAGTLVTPDVTTVTVTDDDTPGTIQFGATAYRIAENAGLATVRITRTGTNLASEVTVQFTTINGTATAGADYVDATRMLTFAAGETFKDVTIQILDDSLPEGDETVLLTLSDPSPGAGLGTIRAAVLTIVDDEQTLQFSAPVYVVNEAARTAVIGVTRTGPAVGTVTVDYASVAGSATAGADYTDVSGTLTFGAGITSRTFAVPLVSDTRSETAETIALVLSNVTGGAQIGPLGTATVTIVDDDQPGALRFSANAYTVSEAAGAATIVVQRVLGATAGAVTVDYATVADGTASAGLDYLTTSGTLFFGAGETSKSFTVPILNDRRVEPAETLSVLLSNPTGGATLGTPSTATLTIVDDDVPGTVSFSAPTYTVLEGAGLAIVTVKRSGGAAGGVTIDFTTADGSATGGLDYTPVSGTLSFGPGDTASVVAIPILDDTTREGGETVRLILSNPTGGVALGSYDQAVLTIIDNETGPVVGFGAMTFSVAENVAGGKANVTIVRAGSTLAGQSVLFSTAAGGTAAAGADYTPVVDQVVTFAAGQTGVTVQVPIVNNTSVDGDRTVNLALAPGGPNPIPVGSPATAVLTILDDDSTLQFSRPSYSVSEGVTASLIVTRTGGALGSATVAYATASGTATAPGDYVATSGTLTFAPGVTSQTITIATLDDAVVEGSEFFTVTLASPTPAGTSLGSPSSATVTITDNDAPGVLQFATGSMTVAEGAPATVMVTRAGGTAGMVTVRYGTSDGDGSAAAVAGRSYTATTGVLTFPSGVTSRAITVPTKVDSSLSGSRKFTVTLSDVGGGATLGALATVVVGVTDLQAPKLQFAASAYAVSESAGSVTLEVRRVGPTTTPNTVEYRLTGVTATGGEDFDSTGGFLTFATGATSRTITVPIVNDTVNEGAETFTVALVNPTGGAILGTPSVATVTINDDDPAGTVQFGQLSWAVVEGGVATITVTRTGASGPVTVNYATSDGTATAPADYAAASGTLTFQAGEKSKTFTVATATDTLVEGTESVNLTLSSPTNGLALGTPSVATLWILDLQQSIQFGAATYAVVEGGTALLTVTRTGVPSGTVAVEYSVDPSSTAREGADFTLAPAAGTLTFGHGVTTLTIAVRTANAPAVEGSKSLGLRLTNPTGGASLGSPSGTQIALIDNRRPDLVVASLAGPAQAATGRSMMVESTVLNQAGGPAAATSLGIFVSASSSAPGAGTRLALVPIPALAGGAKFTAKTTVTIPTGLPPGDYFLSAVADVLLAVNEVDETNNGLTAAGQIEIVLFQEDPVPGTVQFEQPAYEVTEDAVTAVITIARAGTAAGVTVQYRVNPASPGTATGGGVDYTLVSGTLTFAANETRKTFTVAIVNNLVAEPDKTIGLELVNPGGGATLGTLRTATLTIRDNDVAGTVQFSAATYEVTEGTPSAVITVTRVGGAASGVTVQYRVNAGSPGTATGGGVDYTLVPGTLTFGANETSKTFTVGIVNDTVVEGDETVGLELVNPGGGASVGTPGVAVLTIHDDDAPTFTFGAATYSVVEGAVASVVVQRAGGVGSAVTVDYQVQASSTATGGGVDYTLGDGTVTFGVGVTSQTVLIPTVDDTVVEGPETIVLKLVNPSVGVVGTPGTTTVTIQDNDVAGTVQFGAAAYEVSEGTPTAVITVTRAGGAASGVTVQYRVNAASPGTATGGGVDYTLVPGTLTFGANETSKTFAVAIVNDTVVEPDETVGLELVNATGGASLGVPSQAVLTIHDDDAPTFTFGAVAYSVVEGAVASVVVQRAGGVGSAVTVDYQVQASSTATGGGVDYTLADGTVTFGVGETSQTVLIPTLVDLVIEAQETIVLSLANPSAGVVGVPGTTTVTLADNDSAGTIEFSAASYSVAEAAGLAVVRVTRTGTNLVGGVTVQFTTADGTATAGSDYLDATQVLTFAAGETFKDVQVQILADTTPEGNETISLSLSGASSGAVLGTIQTAVLTILDGPPVTTLYVAPTGDDGNAGTAAQPWRTLEKARDTVRGLNGNMSADITVILRGGEYVLPATVEFTAADSGSNGYSVIYQAAAGERPVLTGGQPITGWTAVGGGIYKAAVPAGSAPFRQLYANGSRAIRARTPNAGAYHQVVGWDLGGRTIEIAASEISDWQRLGQVEVVILGLGVNQGNLRIGGFGVVGGSAFVTASEPERTRIFEQVYPPKVSRPYFFENALEFLDAPGEWYLDTTAGEVYYMPRAGESVGTLAVVVPRDLETLVRVRGDLDTPVHHLQFVGLTFEHTTWLVPNGEGYVGDQASLVFTDPLPEDQITSYPGIRLPGAIHIEGAHHTRLERNVLRHLGASAVNYWVGTHDNEFVGNLITDVSGSGISVNLDLEGNPADGRKISRNDVIRNNYIEKTGRDYYQTVGIMAAYTDGVVIEHNELHDMPYSGISVGWGWADQANAAQNNVVRYNRVWDVLNRMADGGALYTLSRQPGTVLAENYVFDIVRYPWVGEYEINGIFMDEGSNLITVRDNVLQNIADQDIRFNHTGPSNTLINNEGSSPAVIANAGLEPSYADIRPSP